MVGTSESLTFGLVHGSFHGAWCWDELQPELAALGHDSIAVDLPIEDPDANLDHYAYDVIASLRHAKDPVLVGASSGANVIARVAGLVAVERLIYVCGSFYPSTMSALEWPRSEELEVAEKYQPGYEDAVITLTNGLTTIDPKDAETYFFHDCSPDVTQNAIARLRKQWRSRNNPPLSDWPDVPQNSIICRDDRVVNPEWSRDVARNGLGIEPTELPGGHSPFLSRPRLLAETLVALALENKDV